MAVALVHRAMACSLAQQQQQQQQARRIAAAAVAAGVAIGLADALKKIKRNSAASVILGEASNFVVAGTLSQEASIHKEPSLALSTTMRDDEDASVSVKVLVSNFVVASSSTNEADGRLWFPKGAKVKIVEPRVVQVGAMLGLMVDNPASIEFTSMADCADAADACFWSACLAFSNGDFLRAALLYRDCMARGYGLPFVVYSRSCEAWFNLGCFEKAYLDAGKALEVKPLHFGSLVIKGEALCALQEYKLALQCFKQAAELEVPELDRNRLLDAQRKCSDLHRQCLSGKYDISGFLMNRKSESRARECSDYVGAVRMDMVPDMGRGLFATKNLRTGDLILVSNSIVWGPPGKDFHSLIGRRCMSNRRVIAQLTAFFDDKLLPSLDLFRPNINWFERNADHSRPCSSYGDIFNEMGKRNGLCPLATMLNHSCVPNVSRQAVGNALFVHAARDISCGEELTACYFDPFFPREVRQMQAKDRNFTFVCSCSRCKVEKMLESQSPGLVQKYDRAMRGSDARALNELAEVADELDLLMSNLDEKSQQWVQCSYLYAYWSWAYFSPGKTRAQREAKLEMLLRAMHETVPGYILTLYKMVELAGGKGGITKLASNVREILEAEVISSFGKQKPEVVDSVILSAGPPTDSLSF